MVLLFLAWIVGASLTLVVSAVLSKVLSGNYNAFLRISTVFQDLLMWILPAIATAMIITRQPARLLAVGSLPSLRHTVLAVLLLIVSSPLMSWLVRLNAGMHLPDSLSELEQWFRAMEDSAEAVVGSLLSSHGAASVILNILIIGVFAGFSEEIFFRGALQRVLSTSGLSPQWAIWIAAFIFSAIHFQFFGFVPRMLLGAIFGYLLWWSGSLWLPILIHTLNNTIYVVLTAVTGSGELEHGAATSWPAILISAVLTTLTIAALATSKKSRQ